MTLLEKIVTLALERYPDIDAETLRVIPTLSQTVEVVCGGDTVETIAMNWLDAVGDPIMGWGPKTNILIVHLSVVALFGAYVESEETK